MTQRIHLILAVLLVAIAGNSSALAINHALRFDGSDDYVNLPTGQDLQLVQTDFTIEAWVYSDSFGGNTRIVSGVAPGGSGYQIAVVDGFVSCDLTSEPYSNINFSSVGPLAPGSWHHLAVVREGTTIRLFIDGAFNRSMTNPAVSYSGTVPEIRMGRRQGGCCPFQGDIDEVRVWSFARSATAIQDGFRFPLQGTEPGLVAYWTFDEGSGQTLVDHTGRGNDGRLGDSTEDDAADPAWVMAEMPPCSDMDGDGYFYEVGCGTGQDCNDGSPSEHPNAVEVCDGVDTDCDGSVDDDPSCTRACVAPDKFGTSARLSDPSANSYEPAIASGSNGFGIVWHDDRLPSGQQNYEIYFVLVGSTGTPGTTMRVSVGDLASTDASIAWCGDAYGVVWQDSRLGQAKIFFRRIDADGQPLGPDTQVSFSPDFAAQPSIVWTGQAFGIAWGEPHFVYFQRLSSSGAPEGPVKIIANSPAGIWQRPSLVWNGNGFGIAWTDNLSAGNRAYFAALDADGNKLAVETELGTGERPSLRWADGFYGVAWNGSSGIEFARVSTAGAILDNSTVAAGNAVSPSLAWTGTEFGLAWTGAGDGYGIRFSRLMPSGTRIGPERRISETPSNSAYPSLAWDGTRFAVAWREASSAGNPRDQVRVALVECDCDDVDLDGSTRCQDCDDSASSTYPGAPELCNSIDDDCDNQIDDGIYFAVYRDADGDGFGNPAIQQARCDALAGWVANAADCDDTRDTVRPGASETCNSVDDNCNLQVDEDPLGLDTDGDGIHNACDNCRTAFNPTQLDTDADLLGNACDNCALVSNANQADTDADQRGNACDNCVTAYNPFQDDFDGDRAGDACDNCVFDWNATQSDFDHDNQGDYCDVNDGVIYVFVTDRDYREWQMESGFSTWNSYRGSLAALRSTGQYTQAPGSNASAARSCGLSDPYVLDTYVPVSGEVAFNLVTGVAMASESGLGMNSAGTPRANANPCP